MPHTFHNAGSQIITCGCYLINHMRSMWPQVLLPLPPIDHTPLTTTINSLHSGLMHYWHLMAPALDEQARCTATQHATWRIRLIIAHCLMIITVLHAMIITPADPKPYHTSILSGEMWVQELLNGHPDHIIVNWVFRKRYLRHWSAPCVPLVLQILNTFPWRNS